MSPITSPRSLQESESLKILGAYIRQWREEKGLTQEQFAPLVGFTRSYITEIETGKRNISFLTLMRIIGVLSADEKDLINLFKPG
jgi:transcriptional regulator with XRE-family HTH domain